MITVLIVDDKTSVTSGLKKLIPWPEINAQVVGVAGNGQEALDIVMEKKPDVVITDVRMPIMDGLELCKKLNETFPNISKIILSAYDDFNYAREAIHYGVTDYILKPIDFDKIRELTEKIRSISQRQQTRHHLYAMLVDPHLKEKTFEAIKQGNQEALDRLFHATDTGSELVNDWFLKLFTILLEFTEDIGFRFQNIGLTKEEAWSKLLSLKSTEEKNGFLKELYLQIMASVHERRDSRAEALVASVKTIIDQQYCNPDLTVNAIADSIQVTPNYISAVFYQQTGKHISSSITEMRMEKAKKLLKQSGTSVYEVAGQCGFVDAHYFARVFKKNEGLTPSQYRNL